MLLPFDLVIPVAQSDLCSEIISRNHGVTFLHGGRHCCCCCSWTSLLSTVVESLARSHRKTSNSLRFRRFSLNPTQNLVLWCLARIVWYNWSRRPLIWGSDHYPIFTHLGISSRCETRVQRWNLAKSSSYSSLLISIPGLYITAID